MSCIYRHDGVDPSGSSVVLQGIIVPEVIAATAAGSTNTSVALFDQPSIQVGSVTLADWITRTDSATLGTELRILQPGVYSVSAFMGLASGAEVSMGVSRGASGTLLTGVMTMVDPECYGIEFQLASSIKSLAPTGEIPITQTMIDAGGNENLIRVHYYVTTTGGAVPAGSFVNDDDVLVRIFRTGDVA